MKTIGRGRLLFYDDVRLRIEPHVAAAIGVAEGSTLYSAAIVPGDLRDLASESWLTVVASPFPTPSWANLVRVGLTIDPAPGSLHVILQSLNSVNVFCRHLESTNGLDLSRSIIHGAPSLDDTSGESRQSVADLIIPSITLVLEVPPMSCSGGGGENVNPLLALRRLIDVGQDNGACALTAVREFLAEKTNKAVAVDWVAPMKTLNRLGRTMHEAMRAQSDASDRKDNEGKSNSSIHRTASLTDVRAKLDVEIDDNGSLYFSARHWKRLLWSTDTTIPDTKVTTSVSKRVFYFNHSDSNEKVIVWDLFRSDDHFVVEFDLLIPADALQHEWWEWIFATIHEADGNILTAATSARLDGYWSTMRIQAAFRVTADVSNGGAGDVRKVLHCFKVLQGREASTQDFISFADRLKEKREQVYNSLSIKRKRLDRSENLDEFPSTLQNVTIWDPRYANPAPREYVARFAANPYSFTRPLDLKSYRSLYGTTSSFKDKRTRERLAFQIIATLTDMSAENIAIVGAPRAGKTTVLNLVYDLLDTSGGERSRKATEHSGPETGRSNATIIPVRINASMTSPLLIFSEACSQIDAWNQRQPRSHAAKIAESLQVAVARAMAEVSSIMKIGLRFPGVVEIAAERDPQDVRDRRIEAALDEVSKLRRVLTWAIESVTPTQGVDLLYRSLKALGEIVEKEELLLVMIVDEVSTLSRWDRDEYFPVWRQVIESREFQRIRWLISTSRPLEVSTKYSPITNVFKEHNLLSLHREESESFLNAFSPPGSSDRKDLYPMMTFYGREFIADITSRLPYLMQVICYHAYKRATHAYAPMVSSRACRQLLVNEVLPEISDYLEHQWEQVPSKVKDYVLGALGGLPRSANDFVRHYPMLLKGHGELPPHCQKALQRSGLRGDDDYIVAPIVAFWLLNAT